MLRGEHVWIAHLGPWWWIRAADIAIDSSFRYSTAKCEVNALKGVSLQIWKYRNFFFHISKVDIQEYALKRIFQNFNNFMSYSHFCDAASAPVRSEQMNGRLCPSTYIWIPSWNLYCILSLFIDFIWIYQSCTFHNWSMLFRYEVYFYNIIFDNMNFGIIFMSNINYVI